MDAASAIAEVLALPKRWQPAVFILSPTVAQDNAGLMLTLPAGMTHEIVLTGEAMVVRARELNAEGKIVAALSPNQCSLWIPRPELGSIPTYMRYRTEVQALVGPGRWQRVKQ